MALEGPVTICDPSDKFRPEKPEEQFRNFTKNGEFYDRVARTYYTMHTYQTYEYVQKQKSIWCSFNHAKMTIWEALDALNHLVDESDPDCNVPNAVHAFQTAERIREVHPDKDWFHLTGLIHDLGKVMALWGQPQWSVVGDTFPVGCAPRDSIVLGEDTFKDNEDLRNPKYNSRLGVYTANCGLDNVVMSWGHDEYMYQVLQHNGTTLPKEALYMVRYHSFYPWHTGGDYSDLTNEEDVDMMDWVLEFNKFDLYSKADDLPKQDLLKPYYASLIEKYIPGVLEF